MTPGERVKSHPKSIGSNATLLGRSEEKTSENNTVLTEADQQCAVAYAAHYTTKDLRAASIHIKV